MEKLSIFYNKTPATVLAPGASSTREKHRPTWLHFFHFQTLEHSQETSWYNEDFSSFWLDGWLRELMQQLTGSPETWMSVSYHGPAQQTIQPCFQETSK
ncbi:hypothetical protein SLA2020_468440 [Shorea laevis]